MKRVKYCLECYKLLEYKIDLEYQCMVGAFCCHTSYCLCSWREDNTKTESSILDLAQQSLVEKLQVEQPEKPL